MRQFQHIKWDVRDAIGVLAISNKPENYLEYPEFLDINELKKWIIDHSLKGLIIHGDGRHFSAGGNLDNIKELIEDNALQENIKKGKAILDYIEQLNIPTIAAIRGSCFGGGLEVALACHIRICTEKSLFALPETNHELIPGLGGTVRLPRAININHAISLIMKGDIINAETAYKIGLVDEIVPTKDVVSEAMQKIKKMTDNRPLEVIHAVVESIRNAKYMSRDEAMERETNLFCNLAIKKNE